MNKSPLYKLVASGLLGVLVTTPSLQASEIKIKLKQQLNLPRIIGGEQTVDGERPWMGALQFDGEHFCGASLIDTDWVLTAAHCIEDVSPNEVSSLSVRLNMTDLSSSDGETHQVAAIYPHQGYAQGESTDIALLKLATPVSSHIHPVLLADSSMMQSSGQPGDLASVSGWGNTSTDGVNYPQKLRNVTVPIVSNEICNSPEAYGGDVKLTEMCAGYAEGGKDSCQGDSGGPLVIRHDGDFVQAGVVSWGDGCALPNKYGVYARVASFTDWIEDVKAGNVDAGGGTDTGAPQDGQLISGKLVSGLSGDSDSQVVFEIDVPQGAKLLWVDIKGGSGDADLYMAREYEPTLDDYQFAPFKDGNNEHVLKRRPKAGTWYVMIHAYDAYEGLELMAFVR